MIYWWAGASSFQDGHLRVLTANDCWFACLFCLPKFQAPKWHDFPSKDSFRESVAPDPLHIGGAQGHAWTKVILWSQGTRTGPKKHIVFTIATYNGLTCGVQKVCFVSWVANKSRKSLLPVSLSLHLRQPPPDFSEFSQTNFWPTCDFSGFHFAFCEQVDFVQVPGLSRTTRPFPRSHLLP